MRTVTKDNITDVFLSYFGKDTDPRMREVMESLARHLHSFAKEVNLNHAEWQKGIEFMEWAGRISDAERHEFVLLSDVLGLSSLVDMINSAPEGTSSSVLGPFHVAGAPDIPFGHDMKRHYEGEILLACGTVVDSEGNPVEGARLDIWQTAPNGPLFEPGRRTGHLFVPRHSDDGFRRPLRVHHRQTGELHRSDRRPCW